MERHLSSACVNFMKSCFSGLLLVQFYCKIKHLVKCKFEKQSDPECSSFQKFFPRIVLLLHCTLLRRNMITGEVSQMLREFLSRYLFTQCIRRRRRKADRQQVSDFLEAIFHARHDRQAEFKYGGPTSSVCLSFCS